MNKIITILSGIAICITIGIICQINREYKLQHSLETTAVVTYKSDYITKGYGAHITYFVQNKKFENIGIDCDCRELEVGDTMLIKFAIENPRIVRIVEKYYSKKR